MAEAYRHLAGGGNLYHPPLPHLGVDVRTAGDRATGQDFEGEMPIRHPDHPYNPLAYKHENLAIVPPGERSLNQYKVGVWDERIFPHVGIHADDIQLGRGTVVNHAEGPRHDEGTIITHHSGQRVRYTTDPATGLYVYRGLVQDTHEKDPPMWGSTNYHKGVDRSDYWHTPHPVTQLAESNPPRRPAAYSIDNQQFYKPLPDNVKGRGGEYHAHLLGTKGSRGWGGPRSAGTALADHRRHIPH